VVAAVQVRAVREQVAQEQAAQVRAVREQAVREQAAREHEQRVRAVQELRRALQLRKPTTTKTTPQRVLRVQHQRAEVEKEKE